MCHDFSRSLVSNDSVPLKYRNMTNAPFLSKILEWLIHKQIIIYLQRNNLLLELFQSDNYQHHSTESAILKVFSNIVIAVDRGTLALLFLLALSTTFDTMSHDILRGNLGFEWSRYSSRTHTWPVIIKSVYLDVQSATPRNILYRFHNILCLGHCLLTLFTDNIDRSIQAPNLLLHCYAYNTEL